MRGPYGGIDALFGFLEELGSVRPRDPALKSACNIPNVPILTVQSVLSVLDCTVPRHTFWADRSGRFRCPNRAGGGVNGAASTLGRLDKTTPAASHRPCKPLDIE
jgi:hypothetical protein